MGTNRDDGAQAQQAVLDFLSRPETHGLDGAPVRIDTHAGAVFLAGGLAYKLKRAVRYPFLDFTTIERRRAACEAEIALNRPAAPQIYIDTMPIVRRSDGSLALGGEGAVIDWVVRMHRFDPGATLDRIAARGQFDAGLIRPLAKRIVEAHSRAAVPSEAPASWRARLSEIADRNVVELGGWPDLFPPDEVGSLGRITAERLRTLAPLLDGRASAGFVRRCHGDLHLRNIVVIDGEPVLFDALEFDDALATCDVFYDLAFLLMDLWQRDLKAEANAVLNRYLWEAGTDLHLAGCATLPVFMSMRAAIRAKVGAESLRFLPDGDELDDARRGTRQYFALAVDLLRPVAPRLVAVGGLSGSGKSTLAASIACSLGQPPGAVLLRSDIERKLMFGAAETERLPEGAYAHDVTAEVYGRIRRKADSVLQAGGAVVLDAVHDLTSEREAAEAVARSRGVPFTGLWLDAPDGDLLRRVATRRDDASDAGEEVVRAQLARARRPSGWMRIDASAGPEAVLAAARRGLGIGDGAAGP